MSLYTDVHAHLDFFSEEERAGVIERAKNAGVKFIVSNGVTKESDRKILEISKKYPTVKAALGFYPTLALDADIDEEINFIKKNKNKIVAIGEVGLDLKEAPDKLNEQKIMFEKFISLAKELKKPIIVHSRKAEQECIELLESSGHKKIIMHCFSGNFKLVKRIIDNRWSFSIPTNVVFSNHFQKIIELCPLSHLFAETDSPYLSPFRGMRNEPAFVVESYKKIAEIKGLDLKEVENNLFKNYQDVFG